MKNGYEYYYLFGLDIPLEKYGLGSIKQPKIIDFLSKDIGIDSFYYPFMINDVIVGQSKDKDLVIKLKDSIGDFTFLLMNCIQNNREDIIYSLKQSLMLLYDTENIKITEEFTMKIDDIEINNSNFNILCDTVFEMFKVDKSKFKFDIPKQEELDPITARFEMLRKKHREKVGNKNEVSLIDIINIIIHSSSLKYDDLLNFTVYQIKNTFETISSKDSYETMMQYKLSQKFDIKEDVKNWYFKKIVKSSNLKGV